MSVPTLLERLASLLPEASRTTLRRMVADRRVLVDGRPARSLAQEAPASAQVRVLPRDAAPQRRAGVASDSRPRATGRQAAPVPVVHADEHLLVVNKPAGLLTSSVPRERRPTLLGLLRAWIGPRLWLVHRLDLDASGLLVFARTADAMASLKAQFRNRTAGRRYAALVHGEPAPQQGTIRSRLVELPDGSVRSTRRPDSGDAAVTRYQTVASRGGISLVHVELETGRKHQIRAHLAERGWPIVNDPLYREGIARRAPPGPLMLCAVELRLKHPDGRGPVVFRCELPEPMRAMIEASGDAGADGAPGDARHVRRP